MGSGSGMRLERAQAAYTGVFGEAAQAACEAPGRVNLIGEHIDYAGGSVLPFAIQYGVAVAAGQPRNDADLVLHFAPDSPVKPTEEQLATAIQLAKEILQRLGVQSRGWQFALWSDLPIGAGLSSSAALEVALAGAILGAVGRSTAPPLLDPARLCQLCRDAEEAATGVQCGLMDQYASMFGQAGCAVHFGTVSLTHQYAPLQLSETVLAVVDSGQTRTLEVSSYNERRAELARGHRGRVRHVQSEKKRVIAASKALAAGDDQKLGELLNASHASLRDDYEVSTPQLDVLCHLLTAGDLAYGARLTGAGFGGSVLALLRRDAVEPGCSGECPTDLVLSQYGQETGLKPTLRLVTPSDGATLQAGAGGPILLRDWLQQPASSAGPKRAEHCSAPTADPTEGVA